MKEEIVITTFKRVSNLVDQLKEDMPRFMKSLHDLNIPQDEIIALIDEYVDIMQLVGEIMSANAMLIDYGYRNTLGKRPQKH